MNKIVHSSGAEAEVKKELGLTSAYSLQDNYDDVQAHLRACLRCLLSVSAIYQRNKVGPNSTQVFAGRPKELQKHTVEYHDAHLERQHTEAQKTTATQSVKNEISKHRTEKHQESMKRARERELEAQAQKKPGAQSTSPSASPLVVVPLRA